MTRPPGTDRALHVAALHALAPATSPTTCSPASRRTDDPATAFVGEFGPVMVVHTGPGLAGLAWWWEQQP